VIDFTPAGTRLTKRVNEALHARESQLELPMPAADAVQVLDAVTDAARPYRLRLCCHSTTKLRNGQSTTELNANMPGERSSNTPDVWRNQPPRPT
jgi:hypothetical protein